MIKIKKKKNNENENWEGKVLAKWDIKTAGVDEYANDSSIVERIVVQKC